jgi:hypothetical protein
MMEADAFDCAFNAIAERMVAIVIRSKNRAVIFTNG